MGLQCRTRCTAWNDYAEVNTCPCLFRPRLQSSGSRDWGSPLSQGCHRRYSGSCPQPPFQNLFDQVNCLSNTVPANWIGDMQRPLVTQNLASSCYGCAEYHSFGVDEIIFKFLQNFFIKLLMS